MLAGFVDTYDLLGKRLDPEYGSDLRLGDEGLQKAAWHWQVLCDREQQRLERIYKVVEDPFMGCMVCARSTRAHLHDGRFRGHAVTAAADTMHAVLAGNAA